MHINSLTIMESCSAEHTQYFPHWHPLQKGWLDALAPEIQEIVHYAQQCLQGKRADKELCEAMEQINLWRKTHPDLTDHLFAPDLVFDENLGTQLEPGMFAQFLLDRQSALPFKPYEYMALTLLKEANGLADLTIVGKRNHVSPVAQHLTIKIARLHAAIVLFRRMNENPDRLDTLPTIISAVLKQANSTP